MAYVKDLNTGTESDEKVSRINSAGLINSLLENLWQETYSTMGKGNYSFWNSKLDAIWSILGGDEEENGEVDKQMRKINLEIYETGSLSSKTGEGFSKSSNPNNSLLYQLLLKKALFLRRLQNKQGKGTAYASADEYEFD